MSSRTNYRLEVLYNGDEMLTTVMGIQSLGKLLSDIGALKEHSVQDWVRIIVTSETPPEFILNKETGISVRVTPTLADQDYDPKMLN
ncbi:hypothetical protein ASG03_12070 [Rhizobium sp. Leaf341]|nr:hypothetical protein ASG03_12070 [Rhizobium sp. Leaf341]